MRPSLTVVLPTFDRAETLPRALRSLRNQSCVDYEVVVVDDGSTDATASVVESFAAPNLRYIHQPNAGVAVARNTGIDAAEGLWVTFLDSDDEASNDWLERFAELAARPRAGLVCGGIRRVTEPEGGEELLEPRPLGPVFCGLRGLFLPGSFAVRRDLLRVVGGYAPGLRGGENTELAMRLAPILKARGLEAYATPEPLVTMYYDAGVRRGGDSRFVEGAKYALRRHEALLRRDPALFTDYLAIAAVGRARAGAYADARRLLLRAVRHRPTSWKHWLRLVAASVPPVGRRLWGRATAP